MQEFLEEITSVYWFLSVLLVGLLLSIVGNALYRLLEFGLSKVSTYWRRRIQKREEKFQKQVEFLRRNKDIKAVLNLRHQKALYVALSGYTFFLGIAVLDSLIYTNGTSYDAMPSLLYIFYRIFIYVGTLVILLSSLAARQRALKIRRLMSAATDEIKEFDGF